MNLIVSVLLRCAAMGALLVAIGCAPLLPSSRTEDVSRWNSYDDAVRSLASITPYRSTRTDVHHLGMDPRLNPGISVLHFADVLQRFSAAVLIHPEDVDQGVRDCLHAGQRCGGYVVSVKKLARQRVGSFWLDSLDFRRETLTTGWRVDVLLVFVDDQVVYELMGGQPTISEVDLQRKPLGPLQGWGSQISPW